jgi:hypothetical protein
MDTAGKIGIGTTSPAYTLDVNGTIKSSSDLLISNNSASTTPITLSNNAGSVFQVLQAGGGGSWLNGTVAGDTAIRSFGKLLLAAGNNIANASITLGNSNGYVGIGTTSPAYTLDVNGTARVITNGTVSTSAWAGYSGTDTLAVMTDAATGVNSNGVVSILFGNSTQANFPYGRIATIDQQSGSGIYQSAMVFQTNGGGISLAERMRIHTNGFVGIGTNAPGYTLDVSGNCRLGGTGGNSALIGSSTGLFVQGYAGGDCYIRTNGGAGTQTGGIYFGAGATNTMYFSSAGSLSNASTTSNNIGGVRLSNGSVTATKGNTGNAPVSALAVVNGQGTAGLAQIELQYYSGGYTHYITSRHSSVLGGAQPGNAIDFWLYSNTIDAQNSSIAPGTCNVNIMSVTAAGVGIGQSAPQYTLDVNTGSNTAIRIGPRQYVGTAADTTTYGLERSRHEIRFGGYRDTMIDKISSKIVNINKQTYGGTSQQLIQSGDLAFFTCPPVTVDADNTVERMRIMDNGNVGIGCNAPAYQLDVNGSARVAGPTLYVPAYVNARAKITYGAASPVETFTSWGDNSGWQYNFLGWSNRTSNVLTLVDSGNVGINCNAPGHALDVNGNACFSTASYSGPGQVGQVAAVYPYVYGTAGTATHFEMGSSTTASGNYGGTIRYAFATRTGGEGDGINLDLNRIRSGATGYNDPLQTSAALTVLRNGSIGINCNAPAYQLDVNGSCRVWNGTNGVLATSGATSWATTSDSNLKNVIAPITNATSSFDAVTPVYYSWKSDDSNIQQVGVIAQEIQQVVPEAIGSFPIGSNDYLSVRYTELIPHLIAAVKELSARLSKLEAKAATTGS